MSVFDRFRTKQPQFGTVASAAPVPTAPRRTIDPARYGFVPANAIDATRPGPIDDSPTVTALAAAGRWEPIAEFIAGLGRTERRILAIRSAAERAVDDDTWLNAWIADRPNDSTAHAVYADSLVNLAWKIRTGAQPQYVSREQWDGFRRMLRQVPAAVDRAVAADPTDPAALEAMLPAAMGLQVSNDEFRALWDRVHALDPYGFTANLRAMAYWRPRWFGSIDLVTAFVEGAIAEAPLGSLLTTLRLDLLYKELKPDGPAQAAFYRGDRMAAALDAGLADLAAADPNHPKVQNLRHWLAFLLNRAGRYEESIAQFQAIGGYAGAEPWKLFNDNQAKFTETRAESVIAWEDAQSG